MRGKGSMRGRVAKGRVAKARVAGRQCRLFRRMSDISDIGCHPTSPIANNKVPQGQSGVVDKVWLSGNLPTK